MTTPPGLRARLLALARDSIEDGLERDHPVEVDLEGWPAVAQTRQSSFVTLQLDGRLRGCVGALEVTRPLVRDVACNAFCAAFRDPRFPGVTASELPRLEIHVSLLSPMEPLAVRSEAELLAQLRPGIDGLVIEEGDRRGTFLPAVWRSLPDASEFLAQLKAKAGFPTNYWSDQVRTYTYTTEEF